MRTPAEATPIWTSFAKALGDGRYFQAHDILEELWRTTHDPRQQAAIWLAAAFHHWQGHNRVGAAKLLTKTRARATGSALAARVDLWLALLGDGRPCPSWRPSDIATLLSWAQEPTRL
jgi:hypothetical protein